MRDTLFAETLPEGGRGVDPAAAGRHCNGFQSHSDRLYPLRIPVSNTRMCYILFQHMISVL
ncbi:MAG: hypothetical protein ACKVIN_01130, partial [Longimicrobiales bacterium]